MKLKQMIFYEDFYENKNLFDFSDYPKDSKIFDPCNKKVIGKMKDEFKGKINSKFVRLKSDTSFSWFGWWKNWKSKRSQ